MIIPNDELIALGDVLEPGKTVLELGNKKNSKGLYRTHYLEKGCHYTCLDWNGEDGALKFDMRYSIDPVHDLVCGPFDVVTNFGFTEHVTDQTACWDNVHEFVKVGGHLVFCTPNPDQFDQAVNWEQHGFFQPTIEWYEEFAHCNNYEVEHLEVFKQRVRWTCIGRMRKLKDYPYLSPQDGLFHRTARRMGPND